MIVLVDACCRLPISSPDMCNGIQELCALSAATQPPQQGLLWLVLRVQLLHLAVHALTSWGQTAQAWATAQEALKLTTALLSATQDPASLTPAPQPLISEAESAAHGSAASGWEAGGMELPAASAGGSGGAGVGGGGGGAGRHPVLHGLCACLHMAGLLHAAGACEVLGLAEEAGLLLRECQLLAGRVGSCRVLALAGVRLARLMHGSGNRRVAELAVVRSIAGLDFMAGQCSRRRTLCSSRPQAPTSGSTLNPCMHKLILYTAPQQHLSCRRSLT